MWATIKGASDAEDLGGGITGSRTLTGCTAEDYDDRLLIDGVPLESMCLSTEEGERTACVERIQSMLDEPDRLVDCYMDEFLTLRTVGMRSYLEILELMEWYETPEGKARTAAAPMAVKWTKELAENVEPARDTIRQVRETGKIRLFCRIVLTLQGK